MPTATPWAASTLRRLLLGLLVQQATGQGRHINMSQVEGMLPLTAPFLIEQSLTGSVPERQGNRHAVHAPHGCYRCAGDDAWLVLSVADDAQWQALCRLLGRADWAADAALAHAPGRRARQAELDAGITQWTLGRSDDDAMQALQQAAVPAGAVRTLGQLPQDPHLQQRAFWRTVERPYVGSYISSTTIFRQDGRPMPMPRVAPTLGEHTHAVLQRLLQLTPEQLQALEASGVSRHRSPGQGTGQSRCKHCPERGQARPAKPAVCGERALPRRPHRPGRCSASGARAVQGPGPRAAWTRQTHQEHHLPGGIGRARAASTYL
jgi:crotonobetainyl-CoA:carnitine CoA-transferase CaiB-like acyl-CoA transferase